MRCQHLGQAAKCKAVDDDEAVIRQGRQGAIHCLACLRIDVGEAASQSAERDLPAQASQLGDDVAVVEVAAGALVRIAGNDEVQLGG